MRNCCPTIIFFFCFIYILIVITIISVYEIKQLRITSYTYSNKKLPREFYGYKIILLSDLHNCLHNQDKIIKIIKEQKPNGVFIAGDIITYGDKNKSDNLKSLDLVKDIAFYSDVYYAPGNHEMGYMIRNEKEWVETEIGEEKTYYEVQYKFCTYEKV